MKKNILVSLSIVGALSALVIGGTGAVFFDREVAERNIFQAGYIDLETRERDDEGWWHGETETWRTPINSPWIPGDKISGTLYLRNDGNVDAGRTTIEIHRLFVVPDADARRAKDFEVPSPYKTGIDKAARIRVHRATFGGTDVGGILVGRTLRELNGRTVDLGAGIPARTNKPLFLEFQFCPNAGAGYWGDRVEVNFTFALHQN